MKKILYLLILFIFILAPLCVKAASLDDFKKQIEDKQQEMKQLEEKINIYKQDIESRQNEAVTLANQMAILKSRISKTELDIKYTEAQIDSLNLEITSLIADIKERTAKISKQKAYIASLIKSIHFSDQTDYLSIILENPSFSEYFTQIKYLADLNDQINQALQQVKLKKANLEDKQKIAETKKTKVEGTKKILIDQKAALNEQRDTKNYLLSQTKLSEAKFRILLAQVRQDYSDIDKEISSLQKKVERELAKDNNKLDNQPSALSWPAEPIKGISTYFHDPTYPFIYLFEHSGIDLPISVGTPIAAAASGYVAWLRTSNRSYGNNIMIIHNDGIATLYAHLSRFNTQEGNFVKRGEIIGYSGGMPGTPGAGFSTGPHLHFEVRENGLPADPMPYLK